MIIIKDEDDIWSKSIHFLALKFRHLSQLYHTNKHVKISTTKNKHEAKVVMLINMSNIYD